jgi:hypothetical protein
MEETREFEFAQVQAVRFKGKVGVLVDTDLVSFAQVKQLAMGQYALDGVDAVLAGLETNQVGWVRIRLRGRELFAEGLLDYASPERLHLENGELGLAYSLRLGGLYDEEVPLDADGKAAPSTLTIGDIRLSRAAPEFRLQPTEMSWEF